VTEHRSAAEERRSDAHLSEARATEPTWRDLLEEARRATGSALDARRLVERASGYDGGEYVLALDRPSTPRTRELLDRMVQRRVAGEPLQYVLGRWGFRRLDLFVDRRVLIPRPETEQVVEVALAQLRRISAVSPAGAAPTLVDMGTGSGAIALSLAVEVPGARVWATEVSGDALAVARANLAGVGGPAASRVQLVEGSWFAALPDALAGEVTMIVTNPPYVAEAEVAALPREVADWEPAGALVAGPTGLEALGHLVAEAPRWLSRPGALVAEMAPAQAGAVVRLAREAGFLEAEVYRDLAGRERVLVARQ